MEPHGRLGGYARDLTEMEGFFRSITARHGVSLTVLRFANIMGMRVGNPISRYLRMPVIPSLLGFDPRFQFIHEDDAVRALEHAVLHDAPGPINVAAPGPLYLSHVVRLGRRLPQPMPQRGFVTAMRVLRRSGHALPPHLQEIMKNGLVIDTGKMTRDLGFVPRLNCRQAALATFGRIDPDRIDTRSRV
jgi:UDP-glucose 4-epimerase